MKISKSKGNEVEDVIYFSCPHCDNDMIISTDRKCGGCKENIEWEE